MIPRLQAPYVERHRTLIAGAAPVGIALCAALLALGLGEYFGTTKPSDIAEVAKRYFEFGKIQTDVYYTVSRMWVIPLFCIFGYALGVVLAPCRLLVFTSTLALLFLIGIGKGNMFVILLVWLGSGEEQKLAFTSYASFLTALNFAYFTGRGLMTNVPSDPMLDRLRMLGGKPLLVSRYYLEPELRIQFWKALAFSVLAYGAFLPFLEQSGAPYGIGNLVIFGRERSLELMYFGAFLTAFVLAPIGGMAFYFRIILQKLLSVFRLSRKR